MEKNITSLLRKKWRKGHRQSGFGVKQAETGFHAQKNRAFGVTLQAAVTIFAGNSALAEFFASRKEMPFTETSSCMGVVAWRRDYTALQVC